MGGGEEVEAVLMGRVEGRRRSLKLEEILLEQEQQEEGVQV